MQQNSVVSSPFGNSMPLSRSGEQLGGGGQQQAGYGHRGQFQMSRYSAAHAQAIVQAQAKAQAHAIGQAAYTQFRPQLHVQSNASC